MTSAMVRTSIFDPARHLDDEQALAGYLDDARATGDAAFVADALGVVARARCTNRSAQAAGRPDGRAASVWPRGGRGAQ
ncbi:MAG: hypothetical protein KDE35_15150 [Geminicoccaceae bacterium]|nr:hypothetical protein [Geminicoccaceae bacterium]